MNDEKGFSFRNLEHYDGIFPCRVRRRTTQLHIKDGRSHKTCGIPQGHNLGAASKEQAITLAQIFVDSYNMAIGELAEIKAQGKRSLKMKRQ